MYKFVLIYHSGRELREKSEFKYFHDNKNDS